MNTKIIIASVLLLTYHSFNHGSEKSIEKKKKNVTFALIHKIKKFSPDYGPRNDHWYDEWDELEARMEFEEEKKALDNEILKTSDQLQNASISEKNSTQEILPIRPNPIKKSFFGFDN